jgi:hypothetical protein
VVFETSASPDSANSPDRDAEGAGFEPAGRFVRRRFSRPVHSQLCQPSEYRRRDSNPLVSWTPTPKAGASSITPRRRAVREAFEPSSERVLLASPGATMLQTRWSALTSSLVSDLYGGSGICRLSWPRTTRLGRTSSSSFPKTVIMTLGVVNGTRGNMLIAILFLASLTAALTTLYAGSRSSIEIVLTWLVAVAVAVLTGPRNLSSRARVRVPGEAASLPRSGQSEAGAPGRGGSQGGSGQKGSGTSWAQAPVR